jgi:hypothetical protein
VIALTSGGVEDLSNDIRTALTEQSVTGSFALPPPG